MNRKNILNKNLLKNAKSSKNTRFEKSVKEDENLFLKGLQYHQANQFQKAEELYQQALQISPNHFNALHMSGVLACQIGKPDEGISLVQNAIKVNPSVSACYNNLGKAFSGLGRLDEAVEYYNKAITIEPDSPEIHNNLGSTLNDLGRHQNAIDSCMNALRLAPQHVDSYNNIGNAFNGIGNKEEAITYYQKAIELKPDFADAHFNLGKAFFDIGDNEKAIDFYNNAIAVNPDFIQAYNNLGTAYNALGLTEKAIESYQKALSLKQNYPEVYNNLGIVLDKAGKKNEAVESYHRAIACKTDFPDAYNNLGLSLKNMGKVDDAIASYKKAIALNPNFPQPYFNLGITFSDMGHFEEAISYYQKAVGIKPDYSDAISYLSDLFEKTNQLEKAMETALEAIKHDDLSPVAHLVAAKCERRQGKHIEAIKRLEGINSNQKNHSIQTEIQYEKGRLYDKLAEYDKAFQSFSKGNILSSQTAPAKKTDKAFYPDLISRLQSYFLNEEISSWKPIERNEKYPDPIFIVGFPRSGTTLLDQILDSHPKIQTYEERPLVQTMVHLISQSGLNYPRDLDALDNEFVRSLRASYFQKASEFIPYSHDSFLVDKLPLSIVDIGLIYRVFPESKIIMALRHPYDVCLSCYMQNFRLNESMVHFLDLKDTATFYDAVMTLWNTYTKKLPINYHFIKYELLISNFDKEINEIFRFLGIQWNEEVRHYASKAKSGKKIFTPSYHQVTEPIYTSAINRWERYVKHLEPIFDILRPHVENFGYDLEKSPE